MPPKCHRFFLGFSSLHCATSDTLRFSIDVPLLSDLDAHAPLKAGTLPLRVLNRAYPQSHANAERGPDEI